MSMETPGSMLKGPWYLFLSKTIQRGPNMLMGVLNRTKSQRLFGMDQLSYGPFGQYQMSFMVNTDVQIPVQVPDFNIFVYIPKRGVAGSYASSMFQFLRNYHAVFHSSFTTLHSHQQWSIQKKRRLCNRSMLLSKLLCHFGHIIQQIQWWLKCQWQIEVLFETFGWPL